MRRRLVIGPSLLLLGAAGPLLFLGYVAGLTTISMGLLQLGEWLIHRCRAVADLHRRLARDWSGVVVEEPYTPAPPEPRPDDEGWYRFDGTLYRRPFAVRYLQRVKWIGEDPATGRDLDFFLLDTVIGPVLGLAVVLFGHSPLRLHGRWVRSRLGPRNQRAWQRWAARGLRDLGRLALTGGLAVLNLLVAVLVLVIFVLSHVLFVLQLWPVGTAWAARAAGLGRRLAGSWSGVPVPETYLPVEEPQPTSDGFYRVGRSLKRTPAASLWRARYRRAMTDPATWRDLLWLLGDTPVTALLLAPIALCVWVFGTGVWIPLWVGVGELLLGTGDPVPQMAAPARSLAQTPVVGVPLGLASAVAALALAPLLLRAHGHWTRLLLAPTGRAQLAQRVRDLARTRADATDSEDAELRRIERDLHDGTQARLVALGLKLSAAEELFARDPERARQLIEQSKTDSGQALAELRVLVRGIRPPVLTERGLADAVRALVLDLDVRIEVEGDLPGRCPSAVEAAAYFATRELVTNAIKHARADTVRVRLAHDGVLRVSVTDDGVGGANPARGSGLRGLRKRLGTFDGTLVLHSPPGGPTEATVEIPCALS
ncbi:sensor histidine kinase [Saccharopolyspora rhizosphaerae]|uniref:histidine kinase n=1 Tax=Saccharopolyspora rhizosphaerae TaxID=2492662 RepID=A0A3R8P4I1_9PSEU|nr:sensor histidine kinase [Saccharopolyspora rhizosphaerae]RRO16158.1 sensor histidine kinase [Saccharopolyspora rhizosphaerae]